MMAPILWVGLPAVAQAHAILVASTPAPNGAVAGPTVAFTFRYNSRLDRGRSRLKLTLPDKSEEIVPIDDTGPEDTLAGMAELAPGHYSMRWQVLAIDGHITRGDVPFDVTAP